jgi:hypothetical protein
MLPREEFWLCTNISDERSALSSAQYVPLKRWHTAKIGYTRCNNQEDIHIYIAVKTSILHNLYYSLDIMQTNSMEQSPSKEAKSTLS